MCLYKIEKLFNSKIHNKSKTFSFMRYLDYYKFDLLTNNQGVCDA